MKIDTSKTSQSKQKEQGFSLLGFLFFICILFSFAVVGYPAILTEHFGAHLEMLNHLMLYVAVLASLLAVAKFFRQGLFVAVWLVVLLVIARQNGIDPEVTQIPFASHLSSINISEGLQSSSFISSIIEKISGKSLESVLESAQAGVDYLKNQSHLGEAFDTATKRKSQRA